MTTSRPSVHALFPKHPATTAPDLSASGNEFALTTFSTAPSSSSNTEPNPLTSGLSRSSTVSPIRPQADGMSGNHTRRRSTSLVGNSSSAGGPSRVKASRPPKRSATGDILEEAPSDSEKDDSDSSASTDPELDDIMEDEGLDDDEETGLTANDRKKRTKRKRRNTRLDERVTGGLTISKEEEEQATRNVIQSVLINALLVCLWYLFSISISLYNKWMFKTDGKNGKDSIVFPFPLFTTCLHMIVQFSLASLVLFIFPRFRPRHDSINPHRFSTEPVRQEPVDSKKPLMTKWFYFSRIGPCGAATGLDIGLGNMSLKFITLTFFTMCKSSALGFVLLFAFLFRLEKPSWKLVGIIATMTVGVVMMVAGEAAFHTLGFILVMSSAFSSGFRWSLTQILLLRNPATSNPFSSIFFLAPVMFFSLLVLAIPVEGFSNIINGVADFMHVKGFFGVLILLFPGCLAFCMTASEFALLKRTSVVTLSICGIFKEVVTISAASLVFGDKLTPINVSGLIITIASIAGYNYIKIKKMQNDARMEAHITNDQYAPVLSAEPEGDITPREPARINTLVGGSTSVPSITPERQNVDHQARVSPIKRPEDLE